MKDEYYIKEHRLTGKIDFFEKKDYYRIIFILSGQCSYVFQNKEYCCNTENIIIIKTDTPLTLHTTSYQKNFVILELGITDTLLTRLSNDTTKLQPCFNVVPYACACVRSGSDTTMLIKHLVKQLNQAKKHQDVFGAKLYEDSLLTTILVLTLRACVKAEFQTVVKTPSKIPLEEIFIFIQRHLHEEITLNRLEEEFYISKYHICREFKRETGLTVHKYIVKSKLDLCKQLLEKGYPMIEIYKTCGLGNYNNLFRAFKKEFGITPKEYVKQLNKTTKD